jgi:O-antigen/teichoic acid export membrane protein
MATRGGARDSAIAFGSKLVLLVVSVGVQSGLAWWLGPEGRGSYAVCLMFAVILSAVFTLGVDRAGQYYMASKRMAAPTAVWTATVTLLVGAAVAMLVGWAVTRLDIAFLDRAQSSSFALSLVLIPFLTLHNAFVMMLVGGRRLGQMAIVSVLNVCVHLVATFVLVFVLRLAVNGALGAVLAANTASVGLAAFYLARGGSLRPARVRSSDVRALLSYGLRFFVAKMGNLVQFRIGVLVVAFFVPAGDVGLFAAASALISRVTLLPDALNMAVLPRVAGDSRGRPELVAQVSRITMVAVGAALIVLVALGRPIVTVFLSREFLPALPLIWIIAPGMLLRAASKVLMPYFMGTGRPAVCSWSVAVGTIINIGALISLLPLVGLPGAAWAMTLGYLGSSLVLAAAFLKTTGLGAAESWRVRRGDLALLRETAGRAMRSIRRVRGGR